MKISETMLKQQVLRLIRKHEPCLGQVKTTTVDTVSARDGLESELTRVNADLNKCEKYLKGLYESLILGDITDSEYKEFKTGYENKIASLKERVKQLRLNAHLRSQEDEAISKARESVSAVNDISELNAEDIDRLIERIKVYRNGRIVVKFRLFDEEISSEEGAGDE